MRLDRVTTIMGPSFLGVLLTDPPFMLPKTGHMTIVPARLLSETTGKTMWGGNASWTRIMVAQCREHGTRKELAEHLENAGFDILDVFPGILQLGVVGRQVTGVNSPCKRVMAAALSSTRQRTRCLESSES